jgi:hypothetical protein
MKLGWPLMLEFVDAVFRRLALWVRACVAVAAIIAEALRNTELESFHVA